MYATNLFRSMVKFKTAIRPDKIISQDLKVFKSSWSILLLKLNLACRQEVAALFHCKGTNA